MRVIKLSDTDDEMPTRNAVLGFFDDRIHRPDRLGRFGLTPAKAGMHGINAGTLLVISYHTECLFLARAASGIVRDKSDREYPAYFRLQLESITRISGQLRDYERALHDAGLWERELVDTQAWPALPDELEPFTLDYFGVHGKSITGLARNPAISVDQLIVYAKTRGDRPVVTIGHLADFRVRPAGSGVEIWPRRGSPRRVTRKSLSRYLGVYNRTASLKTTDYQDGFRHASYVLALIRDVTGRIEPSPNAVPLSAKAQALLNVIVAAIRSGQIRANRPETFLTYSAALVALGHPAWPHAGRRLRWAGLDDLNDWTKAAGVPPITGLIVSRGSWRPSVGFPKSHGRDPTADWQPWWLREMTKVVRFDWSPYCGVSERPAVDVPKGGLPKRAMSQVSRIVRDTAIVLELKALYGGVCQRCGETLLLPSGRGYVEGHHIKPLGGEHRGPDRRDNVICVCPNCHVLLDFAAVEIDISQLKQVRHTINPEFVDYHNRRLIRPPR